MKVNKEMFLRDCFVFYYFMVIKLSKLGLGRYCSVWSVLSHCEVGRLVFHYFILFFCHGSFSTLFRISLFLLCYAQYIDGYTTVVRSFPFCVKSNIFISLYNLVYL